MAFFGRVERRRAVRDDDDLVALPLEGARQRVCDGRL